MKVFFEVKPEKYLKSDVLGEKNFSILWFPIKSFILFRRVDGM
jgi:hypothetical protein